MNKTTVSMEQVAAAAGVLQRENAAACDVAGKLDRALADVPSGIGHVLAISDSELIALRAQAFLALYVLGSILKAK